MTFEEFQIDSVEIDGLEAIQAWRSAVAGVLGDMPPLDQSYAHLRRHWSSVSEEQKLMLLNVRRLVATRGGNP